MFEEICLVCGKHTDDGRAYCTDECQNLDTNSPSISSASSSTFSSPHFQPVVGGDVPLLIPSALGSSRYPYHGRDRYSFSSSSASSTSWSIISDEEDDGALLGMHDENGYVDTSDYAHEATSKSANLLHPIRSSALTYARRPSGTNNRAMVPLLHKRTPSMENTASEAHVLPRSVPIPSFSSEDDEHSSDFGVSSRERRPQRPSKKDRQKEKDSTVSPKPKRSRNRASLPAYFSLLDTSKTTTTTQPFSPVSSSSSHTVARYSPPTPKVMFAGLAATLPPTSIAMSASTSTPRGRTREPSTSKTNRRSQHRSSRSRSRSRSRQVMRPSQTSPEPRGRLDSKNSVEHVFDWQPTLHLDCTRTAAPRRSSSPSPKMKSLGSGFAALAVSPRVTRGRVRPDALDGAGWSAGAPGYGVGRSGLMDHRRVTSNRLEL